VSNTVLSGRLKLIVSVSIDVFVCACVCVVLSNDASFHPKMHHPV